MRDQNFGLECEFTGIPRQRAAEVIAEYFGTQYRHDGGGYDTYSVPDSQGRDWKLVSDSSIDEVSKDGGYADSTYRVELVTPICVYDDIPAIQEILRRLRGARAVANDSCGVHIHISAAPHTAQSLRNLSNIMASKEDMIHRALKVHPVREQEYCKKMDSRFLNELNRRKPQTLEDSAASGTTGKRTAAVPTTIIPVTRRLIYIRCSKKVLSNFDCSIQTASSTRARRRHIFNFASRSATRR